MAIDRFAQQSGAALTGPGGGAVAVTPSDTVDLAGGVSRGVYVGVTGNAKIRLPDDTEVTFTGLAAGVIHPIRCKRVWSTGTTATSILAIY